MTENSRRVALLGLDPRSAQALQTAFTRHAHGCCVLCDEDSAQVIVADFDNDAMLQTYEVLRRRRPQIPVIAVSTRTPDLPGLAYLSKPVSVRQLIESIEKLTGTAMKPPASRGLSTEKIEQARRAIDAKRAAASLEGRAGKARDQRSDLKRGLTAISDEMYFDPDRFLLGHVQKAFAAARDANRPVLLSCLRQEAIGFDPSSSMVLTSLSDTQIRSLAIAPTDDELAPPVETLMSDGALEYLPQFARSRFFSAETFLWNLGYLTSRGRLPYGTQAGELVYLRRWPNLTRVVLPRNAMQVIAYWVRQPCRLLQMHETLGVSMEDVFAVYSAAQAAGLASPAQRQADGMLDAFDVPVAGRRGLFSAILKRLGSKRAEQDQGAA